MDAAIPDHFLGLISGTSVDGIDAALVAFDGGLPRSLCARTYAYDSGLRGTILAHSQRDTPLTLDAVGELDHRIGAAFAEAARSLMVAAEFRPAQLTAIGSHGQTLRHRPIGPTPFTLQLGDPNLIAETTGVTVVADFRRRDVAAGGQGAPLMPAFHAAVWRGTTEDRAVLNLGGIANLTLLPTRGDVRGFDSGPANSLMDAWCLKHTGTAFDPAGAFAASGMVHGLLLERLLAEPWLALDPPKSTGRDVFHLDWLTARLGDLSVTPADVQATLLTLTVRSIADALRTAMPSCARLIVCGGGVHNAALMAALRTELPAIQVQSSAVHGIDPDFVEAIGFAWLARETLAGRPGNLPTVTGARGLRVLGAIYPARVTVDVENPQ
ncbi:MAG: anhydro-N-acetylmuramic acid kinase [Pseudomarimonas sp.]